MYTYKRMSTDVSIHMSTSVLVILWWVSVWAMIEEAILFVSGNRKHIKMIVCAIISVGVIITSSIFPHHIGRF